MTFEEHKERLLSYLKEEKALTETDIKNHDSLSDPDKVEQGYLIKDCRVVVSKDGGTEFVARENNTKLRAGDRVTLRNVKDGRSIKDILVIENTFDKISVNVSLPVDSVYDISVQESFYLDPLISVIERLEEGASGTSYINQLCGNVVPSEEGFNPIDPVKADIPSELNAAQRHAVEKVLKRPSMYCIQGPPGTGKTNVLAAIARIFSRNKREVLIISNTHHAVNNALNKIEDGSLPVIKIGEELKAQSLKSTISSYKFFSDYKKNRSARRRVANKYGDVVGMTLHSAIINLGLKSSGFAPNIVLVDEASQIPLTMAAGIAAFGAGCIVFIGDDRQMPPIFHPKLVDNNLSISIFEYLTCKYGNLKSVLDTTYRMNRTICRYVSEAFYEPFGIRLNSDPSVADRHVDGENLANSIQYEIVTADACKDSNKKEAELSVEYAAKYKEMGEEVAIVTPFRKQVLTVYEQWKTRGGSPDELLVDTVERLQGQDVDVIILTTAVSDEAYYNENRWFILDKQRLNVMISRAKKKVVVIKSPIVDFNIGRQQLVDGEPEVVTVARTNILQKFADLEFYEDGHVYLLHGKTLNSVSSIGHRFIEKPFDEALQAAKYAKKHGYTADYWIKQWRCNSFKATTLGTKTHEFGESLGYLLAGHPELIRDSVRVQYNEKYCYLAPIHPKEEAVESFLKELPSSYHLVMNETKVYSGSNPDDSKNLKEQICGTFDMLYWYDGDGDKSKSGFVILDYKTNSNLYSDYNRSHSKMLLPPFNDFYEESYGLYVIQLNLYALMLEDIGLPVIARKIVWLKDDSTYEMVSVPDITQLLRDTL